MINKPKLHWKALLTGSLLVLYAFDLIAVSILHMIDLKNTWSSYSWFYNTNCKNSIQGLTSFRRFVFWLATAFIGLRFKATALKINSAIVGTTVVNRVRKEGFNYGFYIIFGFTSVWFLMHLAIAFLNTSPP